MFISGICKYNRVQLSLFSLLTLVLTLSYKEKQAYGANVPICLYVCPAMSFCDGWTLSVDLNIIPQSPPQIYIFLVFFHHLYQSDGYWNFWDGRETNNTKCMVIALWKMCNVTWGLSPFGRMWNNMMAAWSLYLAVHLWCNNQNLYCWKFCTDMDCCIVWLLTYSSSGLTL
jgi:hypothetical protein